MLFSIDGKAKVQVAYRKDFERRRNNLSDRDFAAIKHELNQVIDGGECHTSSWIPGRNWKGTVYEPIWHACNRNDKVAAMFYGQILYQVMIERPDTWVYGKFPHARGMTYFKQTYSIA